MIKKLLIAATLALVPTIANSSEIVDIDTQSGKFYIAYAGPLFPSFQIEQAVNGFCMHMVGLGAVHHVELKNHRLTVDGQYQRNTKLLDVTVIDVRGKAYDIALDGAFIELKPCPSTFADSFEQRHR